MPDTSEHPPEILEAMTTHPKVYEILSFLLTEAKDDEDPQFHSYMSKAAAQIAFKFYGQKACDYLLKITPRQPTQG